MKDNFKNFEHMVRQEVRNFSSRPSDGFWMDLSSRIDTDLGSPDGGTPAPTDGIDFPGSGLEQWLLQTFNINLITMITVGSLTLTVATLFFINTTSDAPATAYQNTSTAIENSHQDEQLSPPAQQKLNEPLPDPIPSQKKIIPIPIISDDTLENVFISEETPDFLSDFEPKENVQASAKRDTIIQEADDYSRCGVYITMGDRISTFRSDLFRLLRADNRVNSSSYKMVLRYSDQGIIINDRELDQSTQQPYLDLMQRYNITPCERRLIQLTPEYVAAGEITPDGFRGQVKGSVNLDELNVHSKSLKINGNTNPEKDQILLLKKTDIRPDFDRLLEKLKEYGFKVKSSSFNHNDGLITAIKIHLTHEQGMDWQLRGENFDRLRFRISLDGNGRARDIEYQFNENNFNKMGLTGTGSTSHTF